MLFVRLKQCEVALNAGRLDEAFDLLRSPDLRSHRQGQDLLDRLTKALLNRGRSHLAADQFEAAAQDCDRAARLAGNQPDVVALRASISEAMAARRRADQRRDELAAAVRRHMDQGQFTIGQQLLAAAPPQQNLKVIETELAARRATVQSLSQKIGSLLSKGNWESALDSLAHLERQVARHPDIAQICHEVSNRLVTEARKTIELGHLEQANALMRRLQELPGRFIEADRLREVLHQCRDAAACVERADAAGAERLLSVLNGQLPKASWISDALTHVRSLRTSTEAILAGPLGAHRTAPTPEPVPLPRGNGSEHPSDIDFLLHVDGAGGFRVIGSRSITIGPASSSRRVDVAVTADASAPIVTITRSDEDYFVQAQQPIEVNDKPVAHALLVSGDRIAVGPRCRLRFRRPNPASTSAVLDVTAGRLARGDVRQIILLDREMILGPGPAAHVRVDSLTGPAVLQRAGDGVICRAADPISIDGRPAGAEPILTPGARVTIGPVGLVLVREGEVGP